MWSYHEMYLRASADELDSVLTRALHRARVTWSGTGRIFYLRDETSYPWAPDGMWCWWVEPQSFECLLWDDGKRVDFVERPHVFQNGGDIYLTSYPQNLTLLEVALDSNADEVVAHHVVRVLEDALAPLMPPTALRAGGAETEATPDHAASAGVDHLPDHATARERAVWYRERGKIDRTDEDIIEKWAVGKTVREIAVETMMQPQTISNRVTKFRKLDPILVPERKARRRLDRPTSKAE